MAENRKYNLYFLAIGLKALIYMSLRHNIFKGLFFIKIRGEIMKKFLVMICGLMAVIMVNYPAYAIHLKVCYKDKLCTLHANNKVYNCTLGRNGVIDSRDKREGDGMTPAGTFNLVKAYYRADKLPPSIIESLQVPKEKIEQWSLWGDDSKKPETYNKYVDARDYPNNNPPFSYENLIRDDGKYDLLFEIRYNHKRVPGLGSAIFLHISETSTAGCVALKREDFLYIAPQITPTSKITITNDCK